jgi:hypothetical protein
MRSAHFLRQRTRPEPAKDHVRIRARPARGASLGYRTPIARHRSGSARLKSTKPSNLGGNLTGRSDPWSDARVQQSLARWHGAGDACRSTYPERPDSGPQRSFGQAHEMGTVSLKS